MVVFVCAFDVWACLVCQVTGNDRPPKPPYAIRGVGGAVGEALGWELGSNEMRKRMEQQMERGA